MSGDDVPLYHAPPKAPPAQLAEATDEQVQPGLSFINGFMMDPGFLLSVQKPGLHMIAEVLGFEQARMQSRTNEQWRQIIADKWKELSRMSDYDQVMFKSWLLEVMKKDDFLKNMKVDAMWYERQDVLRRLLGIHRQFGALDMIVCKIKELPEIQLPDKDGGSGTDQDEADYVRLIKDMKSGGGSAGSAGNTGGGSSSGGGGNNGDDGDGGNSGDDGDGGNSSDDGDGGNSGGGLPGSSGGGPPGDGSNDSGEEEQEEQQEEGDWQIFVRMIEAGKTITLHVEPDFSIAVIKALIRNKEGIPTKHQQLMFDIAVLYDEATLTDYNISHESTLQLNIQGRGGAARKGTKKTDRKALTTFNAKQALNRVKGLVNTCQTSGWYQEFQDVIELLHKDNEDNDTIKKLISEMPIADLEAIEILSLVNDNEMNVKHCLCFVSPLAKKLQTLQADLGHMLKSLEESFFHRMAIEYQHGDGRLDMETFWGAFAEEMATKKIAQEMATKKQDMEAQARRWQAQETERIRSELLKEMGLQQKKDPDGDANMESS